MSGVDLAHLMQVRAQANLICTGVGIEAAIEEMAVRISARLQHSTPLVLVAMNGGLMPAAALLRHLDFPLEVDYLHPTRYGSALTGGEIQWLKPPPPAVAGRTVLLVDDILDLGLTLDAARKACLERGAAEVLTAVLVHKDIGARPGLAAADFHAITAPDRYLFGYGMDYKGWWRNLDGIYAVGE
jgi:hypoxanthine phosphoribosyltransferase